jgi:hypothetical protein
MEAGPTQRSPPLSLLANLRAQRLTDRCSSRLATATLANGYLPLVRRNWFRAGKSPATVELNDREAEFRDRRIPNSPSLVGLFVGLFCQPVSGLSGS